MSNYRDDNQDTAIASDKAFGGLGSIFDGIARASDALLFGLAIMVSSSALASDEVIDSSTQVLHDSALIADQPIGKNNASRLHIDGAQAIEAWQHGLLAIQSDAAPIKDVLLDGSVGAIVSDNARINDEVVGQRVASNLVVDSAQASDSLTAIEHDTTIDIVGVSDYVTDSLQAVQLIADHATAADTDMSAMSGMVVDSAVVSDSVTGQRNVAALLVDNLSIADNLLFNRADIISDGVGISDAVIGKFGAAGVLVDAAIIDDAVIDSIIQNVVATDSAAITDKVTDKLDTKVLISDGAVIEDSVVNIGGHQGQAWTANVDSWAMSRYNPYNYNRLVVIDGVLYGEADDGVYRLDQEVAPVIASIKTGKMDLGRGQLTHPNAAYLEYELEGGAAMTVHTTQKGVSQQYTYALPNETAGELTNGRFVFGRGLRGRHFTFELTMTGTHGHINDLSIEHMTTSRRV